MDLETEELHLSWANDHLAKMETRIQTQEQFVAGLKQAGGDTAMALKLLALMRETQLVMQQHKAQILEAIALAKIRDHQCP